MLPNCKLSRIQWKMITNIGKGPNVDNLVCLSDFFKLIEIATKKNNNFKPYNSSSEFNKIYYGKFDSPKIITKNLNNNFLKEFLGNRTITKTFSNNNTFRNKEIII